MTDGYEVHPSEDGRWRVVCLRDRQSRTLGEVALTSVRFVTPASADPPAQGVAFGRARAVGRLWNGLRVAEAERVVYRPWVRQRFRRASDGADVFAAAAAWFVADGGVYCFGLVWTAKEAPTP